MEGSSGDCTTARGNVSFPNNNPAPKARNKKMPQIFDRREDREYTNLSGTSPE
jgi:hypothetical protein